LGKRDHHIVDGYARNPDETPHEDPMEGGVRLPAPGEEERWLERLGSEMPLADI
jgi:hypothetical protein